MVKIFRCEECGCPGIFFFWGTQTISSISDLLKKILKIIWGYPSFLEKFKNFWQKIEKKSGGILNKYFLGTIFPEICEKRGISRKAGDLTEIPRFLQESGGFHWNPPLFSRKRGISVKSPAFGGIYVHKSPRGCTYTNPLEIANLAL